MHKLISEHISSTCT